MGLLINFTDISCFLNVFIFTFEVGFVRGIANVDPWHIIGVSFFEMSLALRTSGKRFIY